MSTMRSSHSVVSFINAIYIAAVARNQPTKGWVGKTIGKSDFVFRSKRINECQKNTLISTGSDADTKDK